MSIIEDAIKLVNGERQEDYGDIHESFHTIAGLWSAYLNVKIDMFDVAKLMILMKVSRAKNTNHRDSYVDIVGYVACVDKLLDGNNEKMCCKECLPDYQNNEFMGNRNSKLWANASETISKTDYQQEAIRKKSFLERYLEMPMDPFSPI